MSNKKNIRFKRTGTQAVVVFCVINMFFALSLSANPWYVAPGGDDNNGGLGWADALATISEGVNKAGSGGTVLVSNGTYVLTGEIAISKALTVRSWNDGVVDRDGTVVDGDGAHRCFYLNHADAVVDGFTITNGFTKGQNIAGSGAGVMITANGGMVTNCWITGNWAEARSEGYGGGGAHLRGGSLWNCLITDNTMTNYPDDTLYRPSGGGVCLRGGLVKNCQIYNNRAFSAQRGGGGVFIGYGGRVENSTISNNYLLRGFGGGGVYIGLNGGKLIDSIIVDNESVTTGGGILMWGSEGFVDNCVISNNVSADQGGGIYIRNSSTNFISNCVIVHNESGGYGGGVAILQSNPGDVTNRIENCTIAYNIASSHGGGISANPDHIMYINNSIIHDNRAGGHGGGAWLLKVSMANSVITNNIADDYGGGVHMGADSILLNSIIKYNTADRGGGLSLANNSFVYNCLIAGNTAQGVIGGGLYAQNGSGLISNCTIVDNEVQGLGSSQRGAGIVVVHENNIYNCIVWSNRWTGSRPDYERDIGLYSDSADESNSVHFTCSSRSINQSLGLNNITNHPQFVDFEGGNYRLRAASPCIDTGTNQNWMMNAVDLDGKPRLDRFSGKVDMGCYERIPRGMIFSSW